jgi:hypothetical protein
MGRSQTIGPAARNFKSLVQGFVRPAQPLPRCVGIVFLNQIIVRQLASPATWNLGF